MKALVASHQATDKLDREIWIVELSIVKLSIVEL
jgi:hypothetical protein